MKKNTVDKQDWCMEIAQHKKKVFSQGGQDGMIEYIFDNIGLANDPPYAVEFGFNAPTLEGGSGSNVANLVLNRGWNTLLLDGGHENKEINLHRHFLTSENIVEIFDQYNVPKQPDYVSIDIDSCDLWVFRELSKHYKASLFSVEYNSTFPITRAITMKNSDEVRIENRAYGASLKALNMVAEENGYTLVAVFNGLDAFYLRNDLLNGSAVQPLHSYLPCCSRPVHPPCPEGSKGLDWVIDYEKYIANGGDEEAASATHDEEVRRWMLGVE